MKRKFQIKIIAAILLCSMQIVAQDSCVVIPHPHSIIYHDGIYKLPSKFKFETDHDGYKELAKREELNINSVMLTMGNSQKTLLLQYDKTITNAEGYYLDITPTQIVIKASATVGCYYALKSLQQIIINARFNHSTSIKAMTINDMPRYAWRGLMLDESRHFFGKEVVMQLLDMMALHKLNKFHWHLTDEQGWRIEIKRYPKLATVGGRGTFSNPSDSTYYYSQNDIREIVNYAAERHIEIIPEIDMPGHASAANRAYPEFSGGGNEKHPDFTFHPGKEATYAYLTNILREVSALFPSKFIHIGGDEVHFGNDKWASDPQIQRLMQQEKLADIKSVEYYFLKRMSDSIASLDKTLVGWDEIASAGLLNENTVVMWWRHDKKHILKELIEKGYPVVMCPRKPLYLDFVQYDLHTEGRRWAGFCPIDKIYDFPNKEMTGGTYYLSNYVQGIQANVWTETMHSKERLQFMIYPRLSAVAESAWTTEANKDYENFLHRLSGMLRIYEEEKITYFNVMEPMKQPEVMGPGNN